MKIELQQALFRDFPDLYEQHSWSCQRTCMCWGFECGDGWEPIIRKLSEELTRLSPETRAEQVKEKYGGLRFYVNSATDAGEAAIRLAESQAEVTCEICGAPGEIRGVRWYSVRCNKCEEKRREQEQS